MYITNDQDMKSPVAPSRDVEWARRLSQELRGPISPIISGQRSKGSMRYISPMIKSGLLVVVVRDQGGKRTVRTLASPTHLFISVRVI